MRWFSVALMAVVVVPVGAAAAVFSSAIVFIFSEFCRARRRDFQTGLVALHLAGPRLRLVCTGKLAFVRRRSFFPTASLRRKTFAPQQK